MLERASAQVVRVNTEHGQASGFIIGATDAGGAYILTNYHVVEGSETVEVRVDDAETYPATVLGYHGQKDLALLEICCGTFQALPLQENRMQPRWARTSPQLATPSGYAGPPSVTRGIVSAYQQMTMSATPGSSRQTSQSTRATAGDLFSQNSGEGRRNDLLHPTQSAGRDR